MDRMLDPSEVSVVTGAGGVPIGYVWEPHKLDPSWLLDPRLIECVGCRHCRRGRMCKTMADLYRKCMQEHSEMLRAMHDKAKGR